MEAYYTHTLFYKAQALKNQENTEEVCYKNLYFVVENCKVQTNSKISNKKMRRIIIEFSVQCAMLCTKTLERQLQYNHHTPMVILILPPTSNI